MIKYMTTAAVALFVLAGCGTASMPMAANSQAGAIAAQSKKGAATDRPVQVFDKLIGMLSPDEQSGQVLFEFGTKGLLFSDAVRKNPMFTVNGKDFEGGWGVMAGEDGKLYIEDGSSPPKHWLLGSYTIPTDRAHIKFRQPCDIKFDMPHTFTVKRPLNPMAHITFVIDLKSEPKLVTEAPKPLNVR
jgi:hypothetical protein